MMQGKVKESVKILIVALVILGLVASYVFTGFRTQSPTQFAGPSAPPSSEGPTSAPNAEGPTTALPQ